MIVPKLSSRLAQEEESSTSGDSAVDIGIFAITALSASSINSVSGGDGKLMWSWAKPSSPYRKYSQWRGSLEETLTDAEWNAGKGFELLVMSVTKEQG